MGPLRELLAVDDRRALEFFIVALRDVCEAGVGRDELLYNASVLAHYSQVSTHAMDGVPAPTTMTAVFDQFVADTSVYHDSEMMETAGAQCLLLCGFFEAQMRRRHNVRWYAHVGASFFSRAAAEQRSGKRALLLDTLARHFEPWRRRHARLSRELRDQPYLLAIPPIVPPDSNN